MRVQLIGDNLEITDEIRNLVREKIATDLEKYLPQLNQEIKTATMTIAKHTRWGYVVNFRMWLPEKFEIFAETRKEELQTAVVDLREQLKKQIKKYQANLEQS